jgi:hypothetical protein
MRDDKDSDLRTTQDYLGHRDPAHRYLRPLMSCAP